jgi:hypothetical protein
MDFALAADVARPFTERACERVTSYLATRAVQHVLKTMAHSYRRLT